MNNILAPKEKALEIANEMYEGSVFTKTKQQHLEELEKAKSRALVVVKQILQATAITKETPGILTEKTIYVPYWINVEDEINKLLTDV